MGSNDAARRAAELAAQKKAAADAAARRNAKIDAAQKNAQNRKK